MSSPSGQSYLAMADYIRDFNVKMIDIGWANAEAVFEFAHQIAIAKAPSDLVELWTTNAGPESRAVC